MSRNDDDGDESDGDDEEYGDYGERMTPGPAGAGPPDDEEPTPPEVREPLLRDRIRERLGVSPRAWYVIETVLLVAPYPFFVYVYLTFAVNETLFLVVTLAYSLVAMYVGFLS